ncbi:hypothetical protein NKDENANG_04023 [Candidatus Entotheonellaceae bacterium PAL068K]
MIGIVLALVALLALAWLWWAGGGKTAYAAQGAGIIESIPEALEPEPAVSQTLVVLSYDLAYGLGGQGSPLPSDHAATIYDRLDDMIETIAASGADVALLREVDFASCRTHDIDQLYYIAAVLGWGFAARATTWECRYLLHPVWPLTQQAGRLRAGMGVISRYPLVCNVRQRLAPSRGLPWPLSRFAPSHTVHMVDVQCGSQTIRLINVHLETRDAMVRQQQARELVAFGQEVATPTSVLMGFFNAAVPDAGVDSAESHHLPDPTLATLVNGLQGRFRLAAADRLTYPAATPSSSLAHILIGRDLRVWETQVVPVDKPVSGRLPLVVQLRWVAPLVVRDARSHHACI